MIDLHKYFLLNVNFSLFPLLLIVIVYGLSLIRKYNERNKFIQEREQTQKDRYTIFRRSAQSIYDHWFFPCINMLNLIGFFNTVLML
jgi:hypothetical protein